MSGHAEPPDRNLALDLVRVTEAAALASARWSGCADKEQADQAAVEAMRELLATVPMAGRVVIGEGEKDQAPMLANGEAVGTGAGPAYDVAVDPVDGTTLLSKGQPNAVSVIALATRGAMYDAGAVFYMEKIATGPEAAGAIDVTAPVAVNVDRVAKAKGLRTDDVTVVMLDRPRHVNLAREVVATGARIRFIPDGDVVGAILTARPGSGVDLLLGTGGTPEGVIAAAALTCLGGEIQGRLVAGTEHERRRAADAGLDLDRVLGTRDLVHGDDVFFAATGITDGDLVRGVRYEHGVAHTASLSMRAKSGTVREIRAQHRLDRLRAFSVVDYDERHPVRR